MNSLIRYNSVKSQLRPGDLIFYWGTAPISHAIEILSGNGPSHVQMVETIEANGDVMIVESTIRGKVNGVQRYELGASIQEYPSGSSVAAAILSDSSRARADLARLTPAIDAVIGKVGYDVLGLAKFLLPEGIRLGQPNDHKMVCSSLVMYLEEAIGLLEGIPYSQASPQLEIQMNLYKGLLPLYGNPRPHNFNTI